MGFNGKGKLKYIFGDNRIVFSSFDDIFLYKVVNFFEQSRFLKRLYTFSRFHNCECVLSNSLEGLEVFS